MTHARLTSKGQITVPKEVRDRLGVEPGDDLDFSFEDDRLVIRPVKRRHLREFRGAFRIPPEEVLDPEEERRRARSVRARRLMEGTRDLSQ